jgi:hypothetical protein
MPLFLGSRHQHCVENEPTSRIAVLHARYLSDNHDFGVVGVDIITIMAIVQEKNVDLVEITRSGE